MRYMGKGTRKVVKHLAEFGIVIEEDVVFFQIEVACSMFYTNPIIGVINKVMSGKSKVRKLFNAQEQGWYYFANPISQMLSKRDSARHKNFPGIDESFDPEKAALVYNTVCKSLLPHDMNTAEANQLIYDVPPICDKESLFQAIHICKDKNARSIPYLHGILERNSAQLQARIKDRDKDRVDVWSPDDISDTISDEEAVTNWEKTTAAIQSMKDINAKTARSRRST